MAPSQATAGLPALGVTNQGTVSGQGGSGSQQSSPLTPAPPRSSSGSAGSNTTNNGGWVGIHATPSQTIWINVIDFRNSTSGGTGPCHNLLNSSFSVVSNVASVPVVLQTSATTPLLSVVAPPRPDSAFNKYLNASDLMEEFIKFCKLDRVSKKEFLDLPMKLYMMWLILEAAKADDLEPPQDLVAKFDKELKTLRQIPEETPPEEQDGRDGGGQHVDPPDPLDGSNELVPNDLPEVHDGIYGPDRYQDSTSNS